MEVLTQTQEIQEGVVLGHLIEIRPLPLKKWHGKKDNESFTLPKSFEVLVNPETGRFDTGLTPDETVKYSKLMGVNLDDTYTGEAHPYFSQKQAWVELPNKTFFFDTRTPQQFIKYKHCLVSDQVANSQKEYDEGKWPNATHVIYDEEQVMAEKAKDAFQVKQAWETVGKLSMDDQIGIVHLVMGKSPRGRSADFIMGKLKEAIEQNPSEFNRIFALGREEVVLRDKIKDLLYNRILTQEQNTIYYMGEPIASDEEDAVKWFKDPNNSQLKTRILEQLKAKR